MGAFHFIGRLSLYEFRNFNLGRVHSKELPRFLLGGVMQSLQMTPSVNDLLCFILL